MVVEAHTMTHADDNNLFEPLNFTKKKKISIKVGQPNLLAHYLNEHTRHKKECSPCDTYFESN